MLSARVRQISREGAPSSARRDTPQRHFALHHVLRCTAEHMQRRTGMAARVNAARACQQVNGMPASPWRGVRAASYLRHVKGMLPVVVWVVEHARSATQVRVSVELSFRWAPPQTTDRGKGSKVRSTRGSALRIPLKRNLCACPNGFVRLMTPSLQGSAPRTQGAAHITLHTG